ncbi:tRNA synthetases class I, catalytic domain-containing protein [Syncephalis pseudoplumigaleata]|uniref:glutamine--tRNA ligase n=1 Tax=Syncephalis pseudoplumigaleata TaxID=1712513 RepID=A0A4P9Z190_9FUNG|nr:tRNA synthetases class I, catalytic domain-containing protein [Syncephalis pseudoplumigaleata]|eukprot:RKP25501.1 tRNA synthetases class I, catalytic domain-containing protein [Syncephalis pseudoplumigaleata]
MTNDNITLFQKLGLSEQKAKETAKNKKLAAQLEHVIKVTGLLDADECDRAVGTLLYTLASTISGDAAVHLDFLAKEVATKQLLTTDQIAAAIKYAGDHAEIVRADYEKAAGVANRAASGIVITEEDVKASVAAYIAENKQAIEEERYRCLGPTLSKLRKLEALRWANAGLIKSELEAQLAALLGPKDERDAPKKKEKKPKAAPATTITKMATTSAETELADTLTAATSNALFFEGELSRLHKPGGNKQLHPSTMEAHLKATGGQVVTRFPPEPNGYLHIGHAKSININFGYAKAHNGICYLRYDDTNPEAEEEEYFIKIREAVEWLGFTPYKITYSSDYFERLYQLAIDLVKRDKAYVCHCTPEQIHEHRGGDAKGPRTACSHRNRPIEESLVEFTKMHDGFYAEGEAVLRMKMNLEDGNPQFWDLIAYRILDTPHHRTGSEWRIYPTYDYTHCLVDSFENITHSLCTLEFRQSRESYYWLCDALEVYKPVQWEFGRLDVTNTVLSKRKLRKLVEAGVVDGWDDPRLYTLPAIRRRGVPPEAVNAFVREVGVTTANTTIEVSKLDYHIRALLNERARRVMAVLKPLRVVITNLADDYCREVVVPNIPRKPEAGEHTVPFTKHLWIDADDFKEQDTPGYYRLAPGKSVGLLHANAIITCTNVCKHPETGAIEAIECVLEPETAKKPKAFIQWVAKSEAHQSPVKAHTIAMYGSLFKHSNPMDKNAVPDGWMSDINPHSLENIEGALLETGFRSLVHDWYKEQPDKEALCFETCRFQFVRIGFFCLDKHTTLRVDEHGVPQLEGVIVNRTVGLKEDAGKAE